MALHYLLKADSQVMSVIGAWMTTAWSLKRKVRALESDIHRVKKDLKDEQDKCALLCKVVLDSRLK